MKPRKKILIIEDELPQLGALCDKFLKENFMIFEAQNGEDGLEIALKEHPDVILLDVFIPKMDGIEMAKKLREDEWGKEVPIIILSNSDDVETIELAMANHVFEYFIKSETKLDYIVEKVKELADF